MVGKICTKYEIDSSLNPTSPVQLSTWERLAYMWLSHFSKNAQSFSHSLISEISKLKNVAKSLRVFNVLKSIHPFQNNKYLRTW